MIELMATPFMLFFCTYKMITTVLFSTNLLEDQKEMLLMVLLVLLCSTMLITISAFSWRSHGRWKAFQLPQGDMGWPVLGETLPFLKPHPSTSIGDFMEQRISKYVTQTLRIFSKLWWHYVSRMQMSYKLGLLIKEGGRDSFIYIVDMHRPAFARYEQGAFLVSNLHTKSNEL